MLNTNNEKYEWKPTYKIFQTNQKPSTQQKYMQPEPMKQKPLE